MKIAVTGSKGRLGSFLVEKYGYCPLLCDVTKPQEVIDTVSKVNPDVIVNCAALTDVDACELEKDKATRVNYEGVKNLRKSFKGRMIQISTDFVFDGKKGNFNEHSKPNPLNHYGFTKLAAEIYLEIMWQDFPADVIIRTSFLYGNKKFPDLVSRTYEKVLQNAQIRASSKSIISPTHVEHLGEAIQYIIDAEKTFQIVHVACKNPVSRLEFARKVSSYYGGDPNKVVEDNSWNPVAKRPLNNGLNTDRATKLGIPIYNFEENLNLNEY